VRFYCQTIPGLEQITADEIAARLPAAALEETDRGVVFFSYSGHPGPLLELTTTEDVFALLAREELATEREGLVQAEAMVDAAEAFEPALGMLQHLHQRKVRQVSFRVVVQRPSGRHAYVRQELGRRVAHAVAERFGRWKRVEEDATLELWVLQRGGDTVLGLRLSDKTMRHRTYKQVSVEASLRPVVARAMVLLSGPRDDDVFLDPMCGAGTILIERGEHGRYAQLLGGDINPEAVAATLANIGPRYKPIQIREWDATALPVDAASVSSICCNLPFGHKIGTPELNRTLYRDFLGEAKRVLRKGGRLVLLTSEIRLLTQGVNRSGAFKVKQVYPISVLGRKATILSARRGD
jgi:tRNA (guanine6-N2)-methyltransferase